MLNGLLYVSAPEVLMAVLVNKTRAQRTSIATTLPAEVARGVSVTPEQELE